MQAASGNTNDSANFKEIIQSLVNSLKSAHSCSYFIGDAALYTQASIQALQEQEQYFITRVPATNAQAKSLLSRASELEFTPLKDGYKGVWLESDYGDVTQKGLLLHSKQAEKKKAHTVHSQIRRELEKARKSFKKLCQVEFSCAYDAQEALNQWCTNQKYAVVEGTVEGVMRYEGKGRPAQEELPKSRHYQIQGKPFIREGMIDELIEKSGYFILATNDVSGRLEMEEMLAHYKSQQKVEGGFRFLKSSDFLVNSLFLKKAERIEALLMVMTVCLMVYAGLEYQIRKKLVDLKCYFPSMKNKSIQNPTARWIFQCFDGISVVYLPDKQELVSNIEERNTIILEILGESYRKIYS